jgi:hypothetical protein
VTRQDDLFTLAREFDLPRRWDGLVVVWQGWEEQRMFLCPPPPREVCRRCASVDSRPTNRGLVALRRDISRDVIEAHRKMDAVARVARARLHAFRCTGCQHDEVWDFQTQLTWDLDFTDYGPDGSVNPNRLRAL